MHGRKWIGRGENSVVELYLDIALNKILPTMRSSFHTPIGLKVNDSDSELESKLYESIL